MSKANKQQVPKIRFNRFKDTWSMEQLANLMSFSNGINAPKESYGKGRKMISVLDILQPKSITYNDIVNSVEVDQATEDRNRVQKGDVIFVRSSEIVEEVGWSKAYLDSEYALHSGFTICGTAKHSDFDNYFVELSLNYTNRQQIERKSGGSTRQNISQSVLSEIKFSLPIKEEQTQISNFFQQLDKLIELQIRAVESAETYKKAMLQKMFPQKGEKVPRVRFEGFSGDWIIKNIGSLVSPVKREVTKPDSSYYRLSIRSHAKGTFQRLVEDPKQVAMDKLYIVKTGDLVVNITFAWEHAIAIAKKEDDGTLVSHRFPTYIIDKMNADFLGILIVQTKFKYQLDLISPGGAGRNRVMNQKDFLKIKILLPKLEEQTQIGNFFQKLDQNTDAEKKKLEQYQTMKRAMLQRMFV